MSFTETLSIDATVKMNVIVVAVTFMKPGPCIWRTAERSLVMRAMRSPIRWCWKYARCIRWRCANRSLRISYSTYREMFIMK